MWLYGILGTRHGEFALPTDRNAEPREAHRASGGGVGDRRRDGGGGAEVLQDGRGPAREVQRGNGAGGRVHGAHGGRGSDRPEERDQPGGGEEKESGGGSRDGDCGGKADGRAGTDCGADGQAGDSAKGAGGGARYDLQRVSHARGRAGDGNREARRGSGPDRGHGADGSATPEARTIE